MPASPVAALAAQIIQSAGLGETTTEVALSPDELGEVRLSFRPHETDASRIVVMMTFERPEAMDLFRRNADQLVADLKMAGFTGADLGFAQSNPGSGGSAGSDPRTNHAMPVATDAPLAAAPAAPRPGATASLDLRL
ncbi:MAG: flagellar hook-length control protein FliK [Tabrizicola sp.]|nr:flagellar hook-length control protein FliK [Tabrizicola sp.]